MKPFASISRSADEPPGNPGTASDPAAVPATPAGRGALLRRTVVAALFVAAWVAVGFVGRLSADVYLLAGVPWMLFFQWRVAKKPLRAMWLFNGDRLRWGWPTVLAGLAIAGGPGWLLLTRLSSARDQPVQVLWCLAAIAGGFVGAATMRAQRRDALRRALPTIVATVVCAGGAMLLGQIRAQSHAGALPVVTLDAASILASALSFYGMSFVTEEVTFRGVLDPFLRGAARGSVQELASALAGSVLWGAWHLPIVFAQGVPDPTSIARLFNFHAAFGLLLCYVARACGTLAPAAAVHALVDTLREMFS